jgi:hypothetical protein
MQFKKSLLTQTIILATIASIAPSVNAMKISDVVKRGYPILNPMASESVDGFGVNNELFLLTKRQDNTLKDGVFYINGRLNANATYSKHSGDNDVLFSKTSQVLPTEIKLDLTGSKGPFTGFIELSNYRTTFNSSFSRLPKFKIISSVANAFGDYYKGSTHHPNFSHVYVNQAYLMLGDLNKYPVYLLAGRKTVDYGMFDELDWFWKPVTNFWSPGTEDQVAVGYYNKGLHAAWSVFNGKTMAVSNTGSFNNIANWAATLSYETPIQEVQSKFGVSYLNGIVGDLYGNSAQSWATYHNGSYRNPAGIIFGKIKYKALTLSGLYQQAFKENNIGTIYGGDNYKPKSWGATAKVDFNMMNRANWVALNYSWEKIAEKAQTGNKKATESQILVGWNIAITKSISASLQYGRLKDTNKYWENTINTYNVVNLGLYAYF